MLHQPYKNLPSLLSDESNINLPYSQGIYHNPGYPTSGIVHGYDIGGTLASAKNRDRVIREILGFKPGMDIKSVLFKDPELTAKISYAQEKGILNGEIAIEPLEGVIEQLEKEWARHEDTIAITVGTYDMARSFLHGARLSDYIAALVTSEEAGVGNEKTDSMFMRIYERLKEKGQTMVSYCDDSERDAMAAARVSRYFGRKGEKEFKVYLVKADASDEELGPNEAGYTVIRSIDEKGTEESSEDEGSEEGSDSNE